MDSFNSRTNSKDLTDKGYQVSYYIVGELLKCYGFKKRKHFKTNSLLGQVEDRNEQFKNIAVIKDAFLSKGLPVLSIDTKKELLGNFYRQ